MTHLSEFIVSLHSRQFIPPYAYFIHHTVPDPALIQKGTNMDVWHVIVILVVASKYTSNSLRSYFDVTSLTLSTSIILVFEIWKVATSYNRLYHMAYLFYPTYIYQLRTPPAISYPFSHYLVHTQDLHIHCITYIQPYLLLLSWYGAALSTWVSQPTFDILIPFLSLCGMWIYMYVWLNGNGSRLLSILAKQPMDIWLISTLEWAYSIW